MGARRGSPVGGRRRVAAELEQAVTECEGGLGPELRRHGLVETVLASLAAGESLAAISRDPAIPCWATLHP